LQAGLILALILLSEWPTRNPRAWQEVQTGWGVMSVHPQTYELIIIPRCLRSQRRSRRHHHAYQPTTSTQSVQLYSARMYSAQMYSARRVAMPAVSPRGGLRVLAITSHLVSARQVMLQHARPSTRYPQVSRPSSRAAQGMEIPDLCW
jgi:hypothetical protein